MNIRKQTVENVRQFITNRQDEIKYKLRRNISDMRDLVRNQTILKREIAKYGEILKGLEPKPKMTFGNISKEKLLELKNKVQI